LDRRLAVFAVASEAADILNNSAHSDIKGSANFILINSASTSNSKQKSVSSASSVNADFRNEVSRGARPTGSSVIGGERRSRAKKLPAYYPHSFVLRKSCQ